MGSSRRAVFSVTELCETPLFKVHAYPWTTVTKDDDLVSHLVSLYFTWCHPSHPIIAQHEFLEAMVADDLESLYCAPILVNAVLALGCVGSSLMRLLLYSQNCSNSQIEQMLFVIHQIPQVEVFISWINVRTYG